MYYLHKIVKNPYVDGVLTGADLKKNLPNPELILLLSSIRDINTLKKFLKGLSHHIDMDKVIGGSTGGEYSPYGKTYENGVLIIAFGSDFKSTISCEYTKKDPKNSGYKIGTKMLDKIKKTYKKISFDEKFFGIVFNDWESNHEHLITNALAEKLSMNMIGGTCGDGLTFDSFYQIYKGKILKGYTVIATLSTRKKFKIIYNHSYMPTNRYFRITKSDGNIIYELNNKPAYEVYRDTICKYTGLSKEEVDNRTPYSSKYIDFTILYPLGVQNIYGNHKILYIRDIVEDSIILSHPINNITFIELMRTSPKLVMDSFKYEYDKLKNEFKHPFIFLIECTVRDIILNPDRYLGTIVSSDFKKYLNMNIDNNNDKLNNNKKNNDNNNDNNIDSNTNNNYSGYNNINNYNNTDNIINNTISTHNYISNYNEYTQKNGGGITTGILGFGETVVKDIIRLHNTLTFVGICLEYIDDTNRDWYNIFKTFEFSDEESLVLSELVKCHLSAKEIGGKTNISQTKLYSILNDLEYRGIISSIGKKPKMYYIPNVKSMLKSINKELKEDYLKKQKMRDDILSSL